MSCNRHLSERIPSAPWVYVVYILVKEGIRLKKALILQHAADLAFCFICRTTMLACKAGNIKAEGGFITEDPWVDICKALLSTKNKAAKINLALRMCATKNLPMMMCCQLKLLFRCHQWEG
ncbi:hypothetical protein MAR_017724 [Mya arenaria]|uniref:Uncharacterized protein n=1 Tax=Mya arenaria TaxID=6604 RepID=A0ABY7EKQ4_MYAAR|nr:hypothetical protein MAR_017724 [Mya arenaria]